LLTAMTAAASAGAAEPEPEAVFTQPTYSSPIAISADNRLVWVVNSADDSVSVLRTDTNSVLKKIAVGDEPQSVAVDPNNTFAFVANAAGSSVSVIKINNASFGGFAAAVEKTIKTGAEPWNIVTSPDGKRVFVANSGQDTITVINALTRVIIGQVNLRDSLCNAPNRDRHFQPRGLAVTQDNTRLYVTRFLSFTKSGGKQGADAGKEGAVCRLDINTASAAIGGYVPAKLIKLAAKKTGFAIDSSGDGTPDETTAFPNQLQSIVLRGDRGYLPNIAASPQGPLQFQNSTEAFVNFINGVDAAETDGGALNLHLGARNPEAGKKTLFFANPWAIAFTNQSGAGHAYAVSAGSDLLVKLNVAANGNLSFTVDADTTRYIDLNDPANPATQGDKAGKNPLGIAITSNGATAYVANFVSRNVSVVNLNTDAVVKVIRTTDLPPPASQAEDVLVGAEMFFSSRGHFNRPGGTTVSTDERLSQAGWQNCASCHFKGWTDGVIWAFASGPRKSVNLAGTFNPQNKDQQKILNYSAIFDEIQDFEANIRNISGPGPLAAALPCSLAPPPTSTNDPNHGLLIGDDGNINLAPCVVNQFTKANDGRKGVTVTLDGSTEKVQALNALKRWVQFAVRVPNGPLTDAEIAGGVPAAQIQQGRTLFADQKCTSCHKGGLWSSSVKNFVSPPANTKIACEVNLAVAAPPGSFCTTAPVIGNPTGLQYLFGFLKNLGSFNLGVAGQGNDIGNNVGAPERAAPVLVAGVSQPPADALGIDYNADGRGNGFNVQSLLGINTVPPYMHNGACETLTCVVGDPKHRTANGTLVDKLNTPDKRALVVKFVESIDADTTPFN
jgi:YVTN family beta-propeller protein